MQSLLQSFAPLFLSKNLKYLVNRLIASLFICFKGVLVGVNTANNCYFYHRDITGNIIGIVDKNHNYVVKYTYNVWGKVSKTVNSGCEQALANNPFMFKGCFYDEESGFYYLKSRYYNPEICRFISISFDKVVKFLKRSVIIL